jgi:hypothetical protein
VDAQRSALIIACDEYDQKGLRSLIAPAADAAALATVLGDPEIGNFATQVVRNAPAHVVELQVEDFLSAGRPGDVLLLHFSCHGLKNESGELFFAARDTRPDRLRSTAISADFVQRCLQASRSRCVVLLLDCCYGGAFSRGMTVRAAGDANVLDSFSGRGLGGGRGRAVITASSAMEYSFEGEQLADDSSPRPSVFTQALVDGLATGDADRDEDGWVSLNELYEYVFDKVRERNPNQTPSRVVEMQGDLHLARSRYRRIRASALPPDLDAARKDSNIYTRRGAVTELRSRLLSDNLAVAVGAVNALDELTNDIEYVASEARAALRAAAVHPAESELDFGQLTRGVPSRQRIVHLLGPAIARACRPEVSHEWIHVKEVTAGFEVSVGPTRETPLEGQLVFKGSTGMAAIAIRANVLPMSARPPDGGLPAETRTGSNSRPRDASAFSTTAAPSDVSSRPLSPSPRPEEAEAGFSASSPRLTGSRRFLSILWALLPVLSLGVLTPFLAPIPSAHAAIRLRNRRLWYISASYFLISLSFWVLWVTAVNLKWVPADGIFYAVLMAVSVLATVHAFRSLRCVFARSPKKIQRIDDPQQNP